MHSPIQQRALDRWQLWRERYAAQQRALDRWQLWRERYADRLAGYHPDVRAEIEATVRDRFIAGNFEPMTDEDRRRCLMRVASRMRIKAGNIPAGEPGSGEQLRECLAAIGGAEHQAAA